VFGLEYIYIYIYDTHTHTHKNYPRAQKNCARAQCRKASEEIEVFETCFYQPKFFFFFGRICEVNCVLVFALIGATKRVPLLSTGASMICGFGCVVWT